MLIIDTHYLLWDMAGHHRFTKDTEALLTRNAGQCYVSSISWWEIAMLVGKQKISLPVPTDVFIDDMIKKRQLQVVDITPSIAARCGVLASSMHGDPADRIIAATAITMQIPLLTADHKLHGLDGLRIVAL
jgi:PIN domain nuclease of toxin-antitoxin system